MENELVALDAFSQVCFADEFVGVGTVFDVVDFPRDNFAGVYVDDRVQLMELAGDGAR